MYAKDKSYEAILDHISTVTGRHGEPLGKNSLNSMLKNERYIGVYTWNKHVNRQMHKWVGGIPNPNRVRIEELIPAQTRKAMSIKGIYAVINTAHAHMRCHKHQCQ